MKPLFKSTSACNAERLSLRLSTNKEGSAQSSVVIKGCCCIAYERLLLDAMHGDSTLFVRRDEAEQAWKWVD